ncbi:MAG TPA: hypothetical protein PKH77_00620 [Anaerolineae bacterium]|nr:hypothetical protein [Anaerolineae bacterium]
MAEGILTITITPPATRANPCPALAELGNYLAFDVYLYLDGILWDRREWPRVPAVGECLTSQALLPPATEPLPITLYTVQAVIGDALGWDAAWHVFVTPHQFPSAQQTQYVTALRQTWDAGAQARAWGAAMRRNGEGSDGPAV